MFFKLLKVYAIYTLDLACGIGIKIANVLIYALWHRLISDLPAAWLMSLFVSIVKKENLKSLISQLLWLPHLSQLLGMWKISLISLLIFRCFSSQQHPRLIKHTLNAR